MKKEAYFKMMGLTKLASEEGKKESRQERKERKAREEAEEKNRNQASKSTRRRHGKWHSQNLGLATSTMLPFVLGGPLGLLGLGMQGIGALTGKIAGPRTLQKQLDYNDSTGKTVANWLVPGYAAYNRVRTQATKDEQDAALQEKLLEYMLEKNKQNA